MANTTYTVRPNQSVADVALTCYGTLEAIMPFCRANDISVTDVPVAGTVLLIPDVVDGVAVPVDKAALKYMQLNKVRIGTAALPPVPPPVLGMAVVLYPRMKAAVAPTEGVPLEPVLTLDADAGFVEVNEINSIMWVNTLRWAIMGHYISDGLGTYTESAAPSVDMKEKFGVFGFVFTTVGQQVLWFDTEPMDGVFNYEDGKNYTARVRPWIVLLIDEDDAPVVEEFVLPEIAAELVSSTAESAVIRFTRTAATYGAGYASHELEWVTTETLSVDHDDPDNEDKALVTVYGSVPVKVGVKQTVRLDELVTMPPALIEMVVEVSLPE